MRQTVAMQPIPDSDHSFAPQVNNFTTEIEMEQVKKYFGDMKKRLRK